MTMPSLNTSSRILPSVGIVYLKRVKVFFMWTNLYNRRINCVGVTLLCAIMLFFLLW